MSTERYLEFEVTELLRFKTRGSTLPVLAKKLGTSEEKLFQILESMVDEKKLVKKGRYYRLHEVTKVIHAEMPIAPYHRILMKFSGLRVSGDAVERLRYIIENVSKAIAAEAGKNAESRKERTVNAGDIDAATLKIGFPAILL